MHCPEAKMSPGDDAVPSATIFNKYAAWYDAFNRGKDYEAEATYLINTVIAWRPSPKNWLDIGCGTGNHLVALRSHGISVEGLDISPSMIEQARLAHPDIPFHIGSAQTFQL